MQFEPNNLISQATNVCVNSSEEQTITLRGSIELVSDIDLYGFQLEEGQGITLDIDTISIGNNTANFDSYLRVFDSLGNELAFNDDFSLELEEFSLDSYIGFIANKTGKYYVGVSSVVNQDYNPINGDNVNQFPENFVAGDYDLTLNIVEVIADSDRNNTISEAIATNIGSETKRAVLTEEIGFESDVDIYKFQLEEGEGINLKIDAQTNDSNLDSFLQVFDSSGNLLAFNNDSNDPKNITTDSIIAFAPQTPGEYYVGVSSAGNFDYDVVNGNTNLNFSPNMGISTGDYAIELEVVEVIADEDPDNTITEAINSGVSIELDSSAVLNGEIDSVADVDIYEFQLEEGEGINLNINTEGLDSNLDSYLRLFDSQGNELTFNDNNLNFTEDFSQDSAIAFLPENGGTYYVGVGTSGNFDYDPVNGRTNFSTNIISPFSTTGNYQLEINAVEVVADKDPNNTIAEAIDIGVTLTSTIIGGKIGSASDVDLYRFELDPGEGVTFDLDTAQSDLDSYLRLFDSQGNELPFENDETNDNNIAEFDTDSLFSFVADSSGEYFVGVSSNGNFDYDAVEGRNNFTPITGYSTGDYNLGINISTVLIDTDLDNTIAEAQDTGISSSGQKSTTVSDVIDSEADVDVYRFELDRGDTVTLDIDAAEFDTELDSVLRVFDAEGNELDLSDDDPAFEEDYSLDSYIEFTASIAGEYYVGVSSYGNFDYDSVDGSNNFSNDIGSTTGNYDLVINIAESV